jgi:hypothetical protein
MADTIPTTLETAGTTSTPSTDTPDPIDSLDLTAKDIWEDDHEPVTAEIVHIDRKREPAEEIEEAEPEAVEGETEAQRDERGRFKAKQEETQPEAEAPKAEPRPFQYRAAGQTKPWDGVTEDGEGNVVVPAAKVGELRAALNARELAEGQMVPLIEKYKHEVGTLRQQLASFQQQRSVSEARADALTRQMMSMAAIPDEVQALEAFYQFRQQLPQFTAKAEAEYWRQQAQRSTAPSAPETARPEPIDTPYALPTPEEAVATTVDAMEHTKLDPQYRDVTADDWKQYESRMQRSPLAFIRPATAEEAQEYGVRAGQPVFDTDAYHADVTEFVQSLRAQREAAQRKADVARTNAKLTQRTITAPPAVRGGTAPEKGPGRAPFKSKRDVDAWFDSDEL